MTTYIILGALVLFFLYLVSWSFKLHFFNQRQKKVKRIKELRAKGNEIKKRTIDCTKDYWYNMRELEDCRTDEDFEKYYHYFIGVDQGVHELLLEMYDCGIVRTDELEEIAYGQSHLRNVDLSFLEELEREMKQEMESERPDKKAASSDSKAEEREKKEGEAALSLEEGIIQVEGAFDELFDKRNKPIVSAAKSLKKDDPGIMDIHGTLSQGVESILAAVEEERRAEEEAEEPILPKKEVSVEAAREARAKTMNAEIRNKIYEKWVGYVFELYELVSINANEDTKHKIRKALMDYGYSDVDVLLEGPE